MVDGGGGAMDGGERERGRERERESEREREKEAGRNGMEWDVMGWAIRFDSIRVDLN